MTSNSPAVSNFAGFIIYAHRLLLRERYNHGPKYVSLSSTQVQSCWLSVEFRQSSL